MRFSILLPTRDRLEYLEQAIESVLVQDYDDWELVVSDNVSDGDVAGYVASLGDPRVKVERQAALVDVTTNWNAAWDRAQGDYLIMLGDDDCLMAGALRYLDRLLTDHDEPDLVYMSALSFAYPGVMPDHPSGLLRTYGYASFLRDVTTPTELPHKVAVDAVRQAMDFRVTFGFNMQFAVVRRAFAASLGRGPFFRSPYPDYYAMCRILCEARRIVLCPHPLVTIGVTRRSFGYFYFNGIEAEGADFLHPASTQTSAYDSPRAVPGSRHLTSWLVAMEALGRDCAAVGRTRPNHRRYRLLQAEHVFRTQVARRGRSDFPFDAFWSGYPFVERVAYRSALRLGALVVRVLPAERRTAILRRGRQLLSRLWPYPAFEGATADWGPPDLRSVFRAVDPFRPLEHQAWDTAAPPAGG